MEAAREAAAAIASQNALAEEHARSRATAEARRRFAAEQTRVLDVQVNAKADLMARERAAEDAVIHRVIGADIAALERQTHDAFERKERARREYEAVQRFNASERGVKGNAAAAEAAADKAALEYTLAKEAAQASAERAHREASRRAALAHQALSHETAGNAGEDKAGIDGYYAAESEKEWNKRQAKWDAEAAARKRLTDETAAYQVTQVAERAQGGQSQKYDEMMIAKWREDNAKAEMKAGEAVRAKREADRAAAEMVRSLKEIMRK